MKKTGVGQEETLLTWREAWAKHANRALEQAHQTRIDHRSYKDRHYKAPANETTAGMAYPAEANRRHQGGIGCGETGDSRAGAEQEHQHDQQLERLNAMMDIGRMLARDPSHATSSKAEAATERFETPRHRKETNPTVPRP